jgi:hypothetical protein
MTATTDGALPAVGVTRAAGLAVRDLLDHPVPLVAANVVWGLVAFTAWAAFLVSPVVGVLVAVVMTWPTATVSAVAARVVRGERVGLRDALRWPVRRPAVGLLGLVTVIGVVIGGADIALALARDDLPGVAFATAVAWGLVALCVLACVAWPLIGDPQRIDRRARDLARMAVTVTLLHTPRVLVAAAVIALGCLVSAVLIAALLTVFMSLAALILCRIVLPLADAAERDPM